MPGAVAEKCAFKVVLCGNTAVGKTSIVHRYCFNSFAAGVIPTMGADFVSHPVRVPAGEATFHIWDTAGQEQYQAIGPLFYRAAALAFVVYSVADPAPLDSVQRWIDRMHTAEARAKIVVLGNKIDLAHEVASDVADWCAHRQIPHFFCSALTGAGLREGFQRAAALLLADRPPPPAAPVAAQEEGCC